MKTACQARRLHVWVEDTQNLVKGIVKETCLGLDFRCSGISVRPNIATELTVENIVLLKPNLPVSNYLEQTKK